MALLKAIWEIILAGVYIRIAELKGNKVIKLRRKADKIYKEWTECIEKAKDHNDISDTYLDIWKNR